jgi:hypothetical protein
MNVLTLHVDGSLTSKCLIHIILGVFLLQYLLCSNAFDIRTYSLSPTCNEHGNNFLSNRIRFQVSLLPKVSGWNDNNLSSRQYISDTTGTTTSLRSTSSSDVKDTDSNKKGMKPRKKSDPQTGKKIQKQQQQHIKSSPTPEKKIVSEFEEEDDNILRKKFDLSSTKKRKTEKIAILDEATKVYPKDSVVSRLKKAARQAVSLQQQSTTASIVEIGQNGAKSTITTNNNLLASINKPQPRIASLRQLTAAIDQKLQSTSVTNNYMMSTTTTVNTYNRRQRIQQPARDSMTAVVAHNDKTLSKAKTDEMLLSSTSDTISSTTSTGTSSQQQQQQQQQNMLLTMMMSSIGTVPLTTKIPTCVTTKNIAIVFSKPLINDQVSIECATRVRRLIRSMVSTTTGSTTSTSTSTNSNAIQSSLGHDRLELKEDKTDENVPNDNVTASTTKMDDTNLIEQPYKPDLICFVGGKYGTNLLNDCDVCYAFFRNVCTTNNIPIHDIQFHLLPAYVQDGAIESFCDIVEKHYIPLWLQDITKETKNSNGKRNTQQPQTQQQSSSTESLSDNFDDDDATETYEPKIQSINFNRLKMKLHFTLVSSEYHLCILNDIHVRSPNQSPLRPFVTKRWNTNVHHSSTTHNYIRGEGTPSIEVSWTYQYATTTTIPIADPLQAFAGKCYKIAQELIPVLQNLRGVVNNIEFFQQDNYRVLVAARRSLVSDMEELYRKQPSLQSVRRRVGNAGTIRSINNNPGTIMSQQQQQVLSSNSYEQNQQLIQTQHPQQQQQQSKTLDVILESALLSMGRCLDLVRPAGLLTGSVTLNDFKIALRVLEQAVQQITVSCDPDQPIHPNEWSEILFTNMMTSTTTSINATNTTGSTITNTNNNAVNGSTAIDTSNTLITETKEF